MLLHLLSLSLSLGGTHPVTLRTIVAKECGHGRWPQCTAKAMAEHMELHTWPAALASPREEEALGSAREPCPFLCSVM